MSFPSSHSGALVNEEVVSRVTAMVPGNIPVFDLNGKVIDSGTPISTLNYLAIINTTIQTWVTNVIANGGSISPSQLGAALYFLDGLNQIGILGNCLFANLCIGNNVQAAAANLIYQGANKYMTGVGGTLSRSNFEAKKGWILAGGVTSISTNFDVNGMPVNSLTTVFGCSDNSNNSGGTLFGFSSHGILKTTDTYGFDVAQFGGRPTANILGGWEALYNSTGDHILTQGVGTLNWYVNGVLNGTASEATTGNFSTSNVFTVFTPNITYSMVFNIGLNSSQVINLQRLLDGINGLCGRPTNVLNIKSLVFEGSSITASFVPPFAQYSPKYISAVLSSIGNIDVNNTLAAQLAVSGQTTLQMYNSAINNVRYLNTNNFNNKQSNVIIIEPGPNSIGGATLDNADHVYDTYVVPMCKNRIAAGYTVILQTTLNSCNYSGYGTPGNTNANDAALGLRRLNYRIKSDPNNYNGINAHGVVLFDEIPEALDPNNTTYYQDGLHPTLLLGTSIWAPITAREIKRAIGRRPTSLQAYQSEIPQYITTDIAPAYNGVITSYRQFKNYIMAGTFNFTLPDPMLFFGTTYNLRSLSGVQTIIGTVDGVTNPVISSATRIRAVRTGANTFSWLSY